MVKEPRPGRVKTRLGRDIGMVNAAWWYRRQTASLLRRLRDPRWDVVLSVAPAVAGLASRVWPSDLPRIPQGHGDLGRRMQGALSHSPGPAVLIGSDIPGVNKAHINRAFRALGSAASVVGPAQDGGFWLIGLVHPSKGYPHLFKDVRWSHEQTLSDALATLPEPIETVDTLRDVDRASDLPAKSLVT